MDKCYGAIGGQQQRGQRPADNRRAAEHDRFHARQIGMNAAQQDHAACGGAGHQTGLPVPQPPDIDRVKAVDILGRIDRTDHRVPIGSGGQGQLHEDAVNPLVGVQPCNQLQDRRWPAIS